MSDRDRKSHTVRKYRRGKSGRIYKAECLDCGWAWRRKKGAEDAVRAHLDATYEASS